MSKLPECPICEESYCPINSVDENGDWDGSSKQNCSCPIPMNDMNDCLKTPQCTGLDLPIGGCLECKIVDLEKQVAELEEAVNYLQHKLRLAENPTNDSFQQYYVSNKTKAKLELLIKGFDEEQNK